jgi:hypothetical protein
VLEVTINAGIGDIVHSHAMLEAERAKVGTFAVALDHRALHLVRNASHSEFADRLAGFVFREPGYEIVPQSRPGAAPQQLAAAGLPMATPDLRAVLPLPETVRAEPYVAVCTKVRGWMIGNYLAIRDRFLKQLERIGKRMPLVLVGERVLTETPEYRHHGRGFAYSIYEDLRLLPCIDTTFPEYGNVPAQWDQFRRDCTTMYHAERVIVLGTGGNCSMAMACGRPLCLIENTEMETYFRAMPPDERITLCETPAQYLEELARVE